MQYAVACFKDDTCYDTHKHCQPGHAVRAVIVDQKVYSPVRAISLPGNGHPRMGFRHGPQKQMIMMSHLRAVPTE